MTLSTIIYVSIFAIVVRVTHTQVMFTLHSLLYLLSCTLFSWCRISRDHGFEILSMTISDFKSHTLATHGHVCKTNHMAIWQGQGRTYDISNCNTSIWFVCGSVCFFKSVINYGQGSYRERWCQQWVNVNERRFNFSKG